MRLAKMLIASFTLPLVCSAGTMGNINPPKPWSVHIQGGFFWAPEGKNQHINIDSLIGNQYTAHNDSEISGLAGIGLYFNGPFYNWLQLSYGFNAFYLGQTSVKGNIIQEDIFNNLAYKYNIQNIPVYLAAKALIYTNNPAYNFTVDAGIGPNFMRTSSYHEIPLDEVTIPDNAFAGTSTTNFSVTVGAGIRLNNIAQIPLECGYRFFYLGPGHLHRVNNQYLNNLTTGSIYTNALVCSVTI
ncbi:hypothetical protein ACNVED_08790 [Legionella sp. D16C41]|uniref:hypothetical protein n=1 Tax=Legionella sp. D16C41 TaxID=3402688 RepID=UPI003AF8688E